MPAELSAGNPFVRHSVQLARFSSHVIPRLTLTHERNRDPMISRDFGRNSGDCATHVTSHYIYIGLRFQRFDALSPFCASTKSNGARVRPSEVTILCVVLAQLAYSNRWLG